MSSDHIIDLGPFAGINGGDIIYEGSPDKIKKAKTITVNLLSLFHTCQKTQKNILSH